jgi:hypothetical protein
MAQVTDAQVVKALKKHGVGASAQTIANELGIALGAVGGYIYRLEVEADPSLAISNKGGDQAVAKRVKLARDNEGLRWERIAGRLGEGYSANRVKELYAQAGGNPDKSYTGRGRDYSGVARKPASTGTSGRRGQAAAKGNKGTSGRRAAANTGGRGKASTAGRGKRGQRGVKDPS